MTENMRKDKGALTTATLNLDNTPDGAQALTNRDANGEALKVLRQIADLPRKTREQRLAKSCVIFLDALAEHADEHLAKGCSECLEQARLLGIGSEREARLMARVQELEKENLKLRQPASPVSSTS